MHGQWSSPAVGDVNRQVQVYFPGGDGWLYALRPEDDGEIIWKFDGNPKASKLAIGGQGDRNDLIGIPVFFENSVLISGGHDPEHGDGVGHLWRIDATKTGDVSAELGEAGEPGPAQSDFQSNDFRTANSQILVHRRTPKVR